MNQIAIRHRNLRRIASGRIACWIVVGASALRVACPAAAENLLKNPSFEQKARAGAPPSHWTADPSVYAIDASVRRSGNASMRYRNTDPNRYALCFQRVAVKPGWSMRFGAWLKTENLRGDGAALCLEWRDPTGKPLGGSFPNGVQGTNDWTLFEHTAIAPAGAAFATLSCYARKNTTGSAWFDDVCLERLLPPLIDAFLLSPNYRGRITADGPREIVVRVKLDLNGRELSPADVRMSIALRDGSKRERFRRNDIAILNPAKSIQSASEKIHTDLVLPIGDLEPGDYELVVRAVRPGRGAIDASSHRIRRMPDDFKPRAAIDAHRRLLIDGKPFFPIGMFWHAINPEDIAIYAQSKFNCLMPYAEPSKKQLDLAWKHQLRVIYALNNCYLGVKHRPKDIQNEADEERWVRWRFKNYRDHPALMAWYLNDELPESFIPRLEAHQRWAEEDDPDHPTWTVLWEAHKTSLYRNSFDIIGTDRYPIGRLPISTAAEWTRITFEGVEGSRAVWQIPQAFNWSLFPPSQDDAETKKKYRTPTIEEIRCMTWQCIAEGATGIIFYYWPALKRNPDVPFDVLWPGLKDVVAEVDRAAPALLSIDPAPTVAVEDAKNSAPTWLRHAVRRHNGKVYLFAVNDGDGQGRVRFRFDAPIGQVRDLRSSRRIDSAGSAFEDEFPLLKVAIYEVECKPRGSQTN